MSRFASTLLACSLLILLAAPALAARECDTLAGSDKDWSGGKIKTVNGIADGAQGCEDLCFATPTCAKWSYAGSKFGNGCSLFSSKAKLVAFSCKCTHVYGVCKGV